MKKIIGNPTTTPYKIRPGDYITEQKAQEMVADEIKTAKTDLSKEIQSAIIDSWGVGV